MNGAKNLEAFGSSHRRCRIRLKGPITRPSRASRTVGPYDTATRSIVPVTFLLTSIKLVSTNALVNRVHGYHSTLPGTRTSQGNAKTPPGPNPGVTGTPSPVELPPILNTQSSPDSMTSRPHRARVAGGSDTSAAGNVIADIGD